MVFKIGVIASSLSWSVGEISERQFFLFIQTMISNMGMYDLFAFGDEHETLAETFANNCLMEDEKLHFIAQSTDFEGFFTRICRRAKDAHANNLRIGSLEKFTSTLEGIGKLGSNKECLRAKNLMIGMLVEYRFKKFIDKYEYTSSAHRLLQALSSL